MLEKIRLPSQAKVLASYFRDKTSEIGFFEISVGKRTGRVAPVHWSGNGRFHFRSVFVDQPVEVNIG